MAEIYYTEEHEYILVDGDTGTVGISEYAQEQLGDVVYVDLPDVGQSIQQTDEAGVVESVKIASEVYAPVSGEIIEVNAILADSPDTVNSDPMGDGWFFKIKLEDPSELDNLKTEDDYNEFVEGLAA